MKNPCADALRPYLDNLGVAYTEFPADEGGAVLIRLSLIGTGPTFDGSLMIDADGCCFFVALLDAEDFGGPIPDLDTLRSKIDPHFDLSLHEGGLLLMAAFHADTDLPPSRMGLDLFWSLLTLCGHLDTLSRTLDAVWEG